MDDAAVDPHLPKSRRDRNGLMRDDQDPARKAVHLHREAGCRMEGRDALVLQRDSHPMRDFVDRMGVAVKFQVPD